jgi:hypothetical protein
MSKLTDLMKSALDKKQSSDHGTTKVNKNTKGKVSGSQVSINKPAKKSAGRGR